MNLPTLTFHRVGRTLAIFRALGNPMNHAVSYADQVRLNEKALRQNMRNGAWFRCSYCGALVHPEERSTQGPCIDRTIKFSRFIRVRLPETRHPY